MKDLDIIELWRGSRKLTIYCEPGGTRYVKVWGTDMFNEMDTGSASTTAQILDLLKWLQGA